MVLSLNTALDRILVVPGLEAGGVFRARHSAVYAGGKGLNVARVLRGLDQPVQVVGFLGGEPTRLVGETCAVLGISAEWVRTAGESRTCLILVDPPSGRQTVVNEPGPGIGAGELQDLFAVLEGELVPGSTLAIAGSAPPGVPSTCNATLIALAQRHGTRVLVDAAGEALRQALEVRPWAVAPNLDEARAALGATLTPCEALRGLAAQADCALLTLGKEGALLGLGHRMWVAYPPSVPVVNAVGSGDAFVAGFLDVMAARDGPLEAVRWAVACGASNAMRLEPAVGSRREIEQLAAGVRIDTI